VRDDGKQRKVIRKREGEKHTHRERERERERERRRRRRKSKRRRSIRDEGRKERKDINAADYDVPAGTRGKNGCR
jgi:DNA replication protein DnaC